MNKRVMGPIAMILAAVICVGMAIYQVGKSAPKGTAGTYTAGTYTATAQGFGPDGVTVSATFTDAVLSALDIQGAGETPEIGGAAIPTLADAAITAQSAEFDGVTGATMTSNAVKEALANCIAQAKGEPIPTPEPTPEPTPAPVIEGGETFTGKGAGFGGADAIVAELTMKDGKIAAVKLTGGNETPQIGGAALPELEQQVMAAQSADIDGVSGATLTSNGVKEAVAAAIAASKGETVPTPEPTPEPTPVPADAEVKTGKGAGFGGADAIVAEIAVLDGKIVDVKLTGDKETPGIGGAALGKLADQVKAAQGPDIDGVSGATMTTNGVKEAVAKALGVAVPAAKSTPTPEPTPAPAGAEVKKGKGAGFGGADSIVAELTMDGSKIVDVKLTGDKETPAIGGAALSKLADQVKAAQSANIDGVTGATVTSTGVREAVANALGTSVPGAKETPAPTPAPTPEPTPEPVAEPSAEPAPAGKYKAGTYTATAQGFMGDVTVTITVSDDAITNVSVEGPNETPGLGGAAVEELPAKIISAQGANVDGHTGATITSNAIKDAVTAALAQAKA